MSSSWFRRDVIEAIISRLAHFRDEIRQKYLPNRVIFHQWNFENVENGDLIKYAQLYKINCGVIEAIISRFAYFWVKFCSKYWPYFYCS